MEKSRKTKKVILIVLLLLIVGLSIGFAAFGEDLTIRTGATVTPNPDGFAVVFSASKTEAIAGQTVTDGTYAQAANIEANSTTLPSVETEKLSATFTEPGQTATWKFYSFNNGIYDAFLNDVTIGDITCTAKQGTDQSKVDEAAEGISVTVSVGGSTYTGKGNSAINGHSLAKNSGEEIVVTLKYAANSAIADGNFDVTVGDIILGYDSIDEGVTAE